MYLDKLKITNPDTSLSCTSYTTHQYNTTFPAVSAGSPSAPPTCFILVIALLIVCAGTMVDGFYAATCIVQALTHSVLPTPALVCVAAIPASRLPHSSDSLIVAIILAMSSNNVTASTRHVDTVVDSIASFAVDVIKASVHCAFTALALIAATASLVTPTALDPSSARLLALASLRPALSLP